MGEKLVNGVMTFVNTKAVRALKDGIIFTLPLTMIGSIFLLLAQLPSTAINNFLASVFGENFRTPLFQVYAATFNIIALVAVIAIAYNYAKLCNHDGLNAGFLALVTFLILSPGSKTDAASGITIGNVIDKDWGGGQGMVAAIIIGLVVGAIYSKLLDMKITIKMPDGVPEGVSKQFAALIPAGIIFTGAMLLFILFNSMDTNFLAWIYKVLQSPLQNVTDSLPAIMFLAALAPFFWIFGIHGTTIVSGVMDGIFLANTAANQAILDKGMALTIANGAKIVTKQFWDNYIIMTGTGITIGLVVAMLIAAKASKNKTLGKIALVPGVFNINEPVTFGLPIVMNPLIAIPYMIIPALAALITYLAISIGFMPPFSGVMAPWTTPPIISGFIVTGWQGAVVQALILVMSVVIYFPFFKKQDAADAKEEAQIHEEHLHAAE